MAEDSGKPVTGVPLSFSGWNDGRQGGITTDANGMFKIEDCVLGSYEIKIATTRIQTEDYYSQPVIVQVVDADITDLEITAIRGASISGTIVVQGTTDPVIINSLSQAVIIATDRRPGLRGSEMSAGVALVGAGGRFEFKGMHPGRLEVRPVTMPEGFSFLRVEKDGIPIREPLAISAGERFAGLRMVVAYGKGSISGQIKVEGGVLPARMNWMLTIRRSDGDGEPAYQQIDASGHFWFKSMAPGLYEITAEADYIEVPGVTPPHPAPIKQMLTVKANSESQILMTVDLKGVRK